MSENRFHSDNDLLLKKKLKRHNVVIVVRSVSKTREKMKNYKQSIISWVKVILKMMEFKVI